jgi:quinol monooxygenase YgiN
VVVHASRQSGPVVEQVQVAAEAVRVGGSGRPGQVGEHVADPGSEVVVAVLMAKSGSETLVRGALQELVEPSLAEPGCLGNTLYESTSTPGTFVTIEQWRSHEDLDEHMRAPHIAKTLTGAGDHFDRMPAVHSLRPV